MKILVTGGVGFIGSHLAEELVRQGDQVIALDNLSTGDYENVEAIKNNPNFEFVTGSILNEGLVDRLAKKVDQIYHLAAAVGVNLIVEKPLQSLRTNIKGSEIVLDVAHRNYKKILVVSSSEIYGKNTNMPLKEDDDRVLGSPSKTRWGYSTAKAIDEMLAHVYWKEKKLPTVIIRLFNTVGPRQTGRYGMVLPRFVKQALDNQPLTVYGSGEQTRCFLYVKDAVSAMIKLMQAAQAEGDCFNVGSKEEVSIKDLANKVIAMAESKSKKVYIDYDQAYEEGFEDMLCRVPDTTKIEKLIGFKPSKNLDQIIKGLIDSFQDKKKDR